MEKAVYGCEVFPDLTFKRGFYHDAYDGRDYISLDTETYTWVAATREAENTKHKWEAERSIAEGWKTYLEEQCVLCLKKYLKMGKETLLRPDPPSARVTRHTAHDGEVTLRCWAQDFYPADISLTWIRDGQEQLLDMESIETRPAGDGTFQKWAAVRMPSGQKGRYTCRVQHEGLPEPLTLKWEPESSSIWVIVGGTAVLLLLIAVIAGVVIWRHKKSGSDSAQGSDISLTAKGETVEVLELERGWCKGDQAERVWECLGVRIGLGVRQALQNDERLEARGDFEDPPQSVFLQFERIALCGPEKENKDIQISNYCPVPADLWLLSPSLGPIVISVLY
ncbi:H-2 class I histocompatibility antigen, alpha chain-like isoform X3 [Dromiciops gliroides]|nr:H-2 class I histocompatibility antigen, alpha chain-like isoform X3 [Dromiciops gliroides]XP_043857947.1 H-2 class I histocompatibility antigen, alpha chain-like isoform X3 [Dromiciops gliroides]XP_043857948.1 H-2 class I histocompatibility antigen, alpha chain-like isoform X3 [Dromiciops gliroides]